MTTQQTSVAVPLELLKTKTLGVLVDSYQAAFVATYHEERIRKERAKGQLLAELGACDPFANSTEYEEYRPA